jgi:hypothetical protein
MKRFLIGATLLIVLATPAFSQSNATIGGIITDATQAVLPGATVTATNTDTGIAKTAVSNAAGVYSFAGVQVGKYKISAELAGFQTQTFANVDVAQAAQVKLNFTLQVRKLEQSVEVTVQSENLLLESSSSAGVVLPEKRISELPLVNSNVLSLIKVMGGVTLTENPIFGADDTQFAGVSAGNVNLQRDGITVNDVRYATGLNSPVYLNPEMIGEFKLVLSPVDAEMGRGNGQVQVITRSGANAFHGSAVWNNQNTLMDANEWWDNRRQVPRDWRNQNEYTLNLGGPIIKNKTFFFVSWDQQFSRIRQNNINAQVPTPCARKTIFRYFDNWSGGNILTNTSVGGGNMYSPGVTATVNADGSPRTGLMQPDGVTPATLHYYSVFGPLKQTPTTNDCSDVAIDSSTGFPTSAWVNYSLPYDAQRTPDTTGYIKKFMPYIALPNNYQVGDGMNWGGLRWVRHLNGGDNIYGLGEGPNRKQINFRMDHNFSARHRISGAYSYESDRGEDSFPTMPQNSYGGLLLRKPQSFSVNVTSTIRPTLLNEARVGLSRTASYTYDPLYNPDTGNTLRQKLLDLYPSPSGIPVVIGLGSPGFAIAGGINVWGSGRGNFAATWGGHDPRWSYGDTLTWTKGRHSMKFGAEMQRTQSYQTLTGLISFGAGASNVPSVSNSSVVYSGFSANQGFHNPFSYAPTMPGAAGWLYGGNIVSGMYNLLNIYSGNVTGVGQFRYINSPTALSYNDITKGEDRRIVDYRQNQFNFFVKDDWKVSDNFTVNLGVRYEWYGVPYMKGGMTAGLKGGALSVFGRSGSAISDWMPATTYDTNGNPIINYKGSDAELAFIGPDSPNPGQQLYNDDYNNFGPAVGFAWQLPWFGKGKTTLRGGYQLTYMPPGRADSAIVYMPKITYGANYTPNSAMPYMNLSNISSLLPVVPIPSFIKTPAADPVLPVQQRSQFITVFDPNLHTPYIQNLTMSLTRNIGSNVTFDLRYIGTLSRKQMSSINLNSANIWNNGLKNAFDVARYGWDLDPSMASLPNVQAGIKLLNKMLNGINLAGTSNFFNAYGPVGTTFNGVLQTGAQHLRGFGSTSGNLANGNYIGVAGTLATLNYDTTVIGNSGLPPVGNDVQGLVLRYNNFPENFIYTSPQFGGATWTGNLNHANYHSLQAQITVRPTHGFNISATYVWSRNLGSLGYTDPRDRAYDYGLNGMNRAHQIAINGGFELPFGPGHWLLNGSNGALERIVGGWQTSWIVNFATGRPFGISATSTTLYGNGVPNLVGEFDRKSGHVHWGNGDSTGSYWWDDTIQKPKYILAADPQCQNVTNGNSLPGQPNLRNSCTLRAVVLNSDQTKVIFQNPYPTEHGNFQANGLTQPAIWSADMAMSKAIKITEGKSLQIRVDATNIFNHAQPSANAWQSGVVRVRVPGAPAATMGYFFDFTDFSYAYRSPGYLSSKVGSRTFQAKLRFDF